jgi:uncharacterized protein with HEPN domain
MKPDDRTRLQHILDAGQEVMTFTDGHQRADFDTDIMLLRAVSMSVGIIGEAASRITTEYRTAHPEIPWSQIVAMRNFVFHVYFNIDPDILWNTATVEVPILVTQVRVLLNPVEGE